MRQAGLQVGADVQSKNPDLAPYQGACMWLKCNLTQFHLKVSRESPEFPTLNERQDTDDLSIVCFELAQTSHCCAK